MIIQFQPPKKKKKQQQHIPLFFCHKNILSPIYSNMLNKKKTSNMQKLLGDLFTSWRSQWELFDIKIQSGFFWWQITFDLRVKLLSLYWIINWSYKVTISTGSSKPWQSTDEHGWHLLVSPFVIWCFEGNFLK